MSLAKKLHLKYDDTMQDWEYEVADYNRLPDYIREYDKPITTDYEKQSLFEMIFDSLSDLLHEEKTDEFDLYFYKIEKQLKKNLDLHIGTLKYWTDNKFLITTRIMKLSFIQNDLK